MCVRWGGGSDAGSLRESVKVRVYGRVELARREILSQKRGNAPKSGRRAEGAGARTCSNNMGEGQGLRSVGGDGMGGNVWVK